MTSLNHTSQFCSRGLLVLCIVFLPALVASIELHKEVTTIEVAGNIYQLSAGDPSLSKWLLPTNDPNSDQNESHTKAMIALGRELFFDKNLSRERNLSCGSCHQPQANWADGLPTALPEPQYSYPRATPSLVNLTYNTIFLWDGRAANLEEQVLVPILNTDEMNLTLPELRARLNENSVYRNRFKALFGETPIDEHMFSTAVAAFERTLVSKNTRFDQWVAGDEKAMSPTEIRGFEVFLDPDKGNCSVCHAAPNFTDNGFHNIGLSSFGKKDSDPGRYKIKPVKLMRGAFKTPSLRNAAISAPYFHDGSARTLEDVISHYEKGGDVKSNLSPEMKELTLSEGEKRDLIAFLNAMSDLPSHDEIQTTELEN